MVSSTLLKCALAALVLHAWVIQFSDAAQFYLGIRYANQPPRWQRTSPAAFDPAALLQRNASLNVFGGGCHTFNNDPKPSESEDCFLLNVWTPRPLSNVSCDLSLGGCKFPVLVWIYGGGFQSGSAKYDVKSSGLSFQNVVNGSDFADQGMIVVTFDFRMGPMGYFRLPSNVTLSPGDEDGFAWGANVGVYDAVTALQWVASNIGYFGGDSSKVTVWGQSSGGLTAGLLMLSPLAEGLMSSVIMNSSPLTMAAWPCGETEALTLLWAQRTRCAFLNATGNWTSACFRSLAASEVYDAAQRAGQTVLLGPPKWAANFAPCVDGKLISQPPLATMLQGKYKKIPVMAGFTADEAYLFTRNYQTGPNNISSYSTEYFNQTVSRFAEVARQFSLQAVPEVTIQAAVALMRSIYVDGKNSLFDRWTDFISQIVFVCPLQTALNALAVNGPAPFGYDFDDQDSLLGPMHGIDVLYFWLQDSDPTLSFLFQCPSGPSCKLRNRMRQYVYNFVKSQSSPSPTNGSNSTAAWSSIAQRANVSSHVYLRWDNTSGEYTNQFADVCKSIFDLLLPPALQFPPSPAPTSPSPPTPPSSSQPPPSPPPTTSPPPENSAPSAAAAALSPAAVAGISVAAVVAAAAAAVVLLRLRNRKEGAANSMGIKLIVHA